MTSTSTTDGNQLLCGHYNPAQRRATVMRKLKIELEAIENHDFSTGMLVRPRDQHADLGNSRKDKGVDDFFPEIAALIKASANLSSQHITKEYRSLQATCTKLKQQLDNVTSLNDKQIQEKTANTIKLVDKIAEYLRMKVHQGEKCCEECELYGSKWAKMQESFGSFEEK